MGDEKADYQVWSDEYADNIGNITINTSDVNTQEWDEWITQYTGALDTDMTVDLSDIDIGPYYSGMAANDIKLTGGGQEMLRIAEDGFYVNGVKVKQGKREAKAVYEAFKRWMTYAILNNELNSDK